jgi:hypothetical protein
MSTEEQRRVGAMMRILRNLDFKLSEEEMDDFKMIGNAEHSPRHNKD